MSLIACSSIEFVSPPCGVPTLGVPISIKVTIATSFDWAGMMDDGQKELLVSYDVVVEKGSWLLGGKKKGIYTAKVSKVGLDVTTRS